MRRFTATAVVASLLTMGLGVPSASAAEATALAAPTFTWRMADRTQVVYNSEFAPNLPVPHRMVKGPGGEPGMYSGLGYYGVSSVPVDEINPSAGFTVSFDGCAPVSAWASSFEWSVDGSPIAGTACTVSTQLPEGVHTVTMTAKGGGSVATTSQRIKVDDILIVNMGDSYSSGEGNPQRYVAGTPDDSVATVKANSGKGWHEGGLWDNAPCDRSSRAGQVQAAIDLEQSDPHTSVTLLNLACSGAEIDDGIVGDQSKPMMVPDPADPTQTIEDPNVQAPQVTQAKDLAQGRQIDSVTLGIGGNDVGFVPIIMECVINDDCFLDTPGLAPALGGKQIDPDETGTGINNSNYRPASLAALASMKLTGKAASQPADGFTLEKKTLHRCQTVIHQAVLTQGANGGAVAQADCAERDYNSEPVGLAQTAQCLVGPGDCTPLQGSAFPSLGVAAENVFYTDYPDLTKHFVDGTPEFCAVVLRAESVESVLTQLIATLPDGNPVKATLQKLLVALNAGVATGVVPNLIGLSRGEFIWADAAVLGGRPADATNPYTPYSYRVPLSTDWKVRVAGGLTAPTGTVGPGNTQDPKVDFVNLVNTQPALGEITRLAADLYGWTPVSVYDGATGHGLCAPAANAVNRGTASFIYLTEVLPIPVLGNKTNISGMAHPNLYGQDLYRARIGDALVPRFASAAVNQPATAAPAVVSTKAGTAVDVDLKGLGNGDPESDAITYGIVTGPQNGQATIANGVITYTPDPGYQGPDQLIYSATDAGSGETSTASVSVQVADNLAPTATGTLVSTAYNTPVTVDLAPLAGDDDGEVLTFAVTTPPTHGTTTLGGSSATYTPADGYSGLDAFGFTVTDPKGATASATVDLTIAKPGTRITVMTKNLYLGADVGVALELLPQLGTLTQFMWDQVSVTDFTARVPKLAAEVRREGPDVLGLQEATTWRCQPDADTPPVDVFNFTDQFLEALGGDYVVASAGGNKAFNPGFTIGPIAVGPVTSEVSDPATFQPLFGQDTAICGFEVADALLVHKDLAGAVTAVGTGDYTDKVVDNPVLDIVRGYSWADVTIGGTSTRFVTTQLESMFSDSDVTTGYKQVKQLIGDLEDVTQPLVAMGDFNNDPRDPRPVGAPNPGGQPSANDSCPAQVADPTPATASEVCNAYWSMVKSGGYADVGPDPQDAHNFTWGASALLAGPDLGRVADAIAMGNGYGLTDRLDYVFLRNGLTRVSAKITGNQWPNGPDVWTCDDEQQIVNTKEAASALGVTLNEAQVGHGACFPTDHASVVSDILVPAPNDPPTAGGASVTTTSGTPLAVDLASLASDPDTDPLAFTIKGQPQHGKLSDISAGSLTYTPAAGYAGPDEFTYRVTDPSGASAVGTVSIAVTAPNQPPTAQDTTTSTAFGIPLDLDLTSLAADPEGGVVTFDIAASPQHGTAVVKDGMLTYTPAAGHSGADALQYRVTDPESATAVGTVAITVDPNRPPIARSTSVSTSFGTPVQINLTSIASDPEGGPVTFSLTAKPGHGTAVLSGGIVTYTPDADYSGPDFFKYRAVDALDEAASAKVSILVAPNRPPVVAGTRVSTAFGTPVEVDLASLARDPEGGALTFSIAVPPAHGTLSAIAGGKVTYTPAAGYSGADTFEYAAADAAGETASGTVSITVGAAPAPTPPPTQSPAPTPSPTPPQAQSPTLPAPVSCSAKAVSGGSKIKVNMGPNLPGSSYYVFRLDVRRDGRWYRVLKQFRTQGTAETRTIDVPKGTYRAKCYGTTFPKITGILAGDGRSNPVKIRR